MQESRAQDSGDVRALIDQWREYVQHKPECELTNRDVVLDDDDPCGYRERDEEDGDPTCTCGLDALLSHLSVRTRTQEERKKESE